MKRMLIALTLALAGGVVVLPQAAQADIYPTESGVYLENYAPDEIWRLISYHDEDQDPDTGDWYWHTEDDHRFPPRTARAPSGLQLVKLNLSMAPWDYYWTTTCQGDGRATESRHAPWPNDYTGEETGDPYAGFTIWIEPFQTCTMYVSDTLTSAPYWQRELTTVLGNLAPYCPSDPDWYGDSVIVTDQDITLETMGPLGIDLAEPNAVCVHGYNRTVATGAGDDNVFVAISADNTEVDLGEGNDSLVDRAVNTTLVGGVGVDVVVDATGGSATLGLGGNDTLTVRSKKSSVNGGGGYDTCFVPTKLRTWTRAHVRSCETLRRSG